MLAIAVYQSNMLCLTGPIASKLAPTRKCVGYRMIKHHKTTVGAGLLAITVYQSKML